MKTKTHDWLLTTYGKLDKIIEAVVIKDRLEKEAENESTNYTNVQNVKDWTLIKMMDEIHRFSKEWGQSDSKIATNLGLDEKDGSFSEMVINHDYIWLAKHNVWIPENNNLYDKRDDAIVEYIKEHQ